MSFSDSSPKSTNFSTNFAVLLIDKPTGISCGTLLKEVRKKLGRRDVGHVGTLDPAATGLLVVLIGEATKLQRLVMGGVKNYTGHFQLGVVTDSGDFEGRVMSTSEVDDDVVQSRIAEVQSAFLGTIRQVPPSFSAIKIDGERACDLARQGEQFSLLPREVTISRLELEYREGGEIHYNVWCSKGTYVRALARDIGEFLGVGGVAGSIRRQQIGAFSLSNAVTLAEFVEASDPEAYLVSREKFETYYNVVVADELLIEELSGGKQGGLGDSVLVASLERSAIPSDSGAFCLIGRSGHNIVLLDKDEGKDWAVSRVLCLR